VQGILPCDPITAYQAITDVETTARYSGEVITAKWVTRANAHGASVGDMFIAHNRISDRTWTSTSTVVTADPGHRFAFAVGGPASPVAVWTFDLTPAPPAPSHPNTKVSYTVTLGAAYSHRPGQNADPQRRASDIRRRLDSLARNMDLFLEAVAADLHPALGRTHPNPNTHTPPGPPEHPSAPAARTALVQRLGHLR
jgi:Polyketide cyclase / dehydrase and lipid transport